MPPHAAASDLSAAHRSHQGPETADCGDLVRLDPDQISAVVRLMAGWAANSGLRPTARPGWVRYSSAGRGVTARPSQYPITT